MEHEVRTLQEIGEAIGEARGRKQVAYNMLRDGMDIKTIAKYTGLPIDEILNLKSEE